MLDRLKTYPKYNKNRHHEKRLQSIGRQKKNFLHRHKGTERVQRTNFCIDKRQKPFSRVHFAWLHPHLRQTRQTAKVSNNKGSQAKGKAPF